MTDQNQQNEQSNRMEGAPAWAIELFQQVESLKQHTDRIKADQDQQESDRQNRIAQAQQPKEKQYIQTAFGQVEDNAQNRALIKHDTDGLNVFNPIEAMQADPANEHMWRRVREAHAAYMAERDQHSRELTPDEQAAKEAAQERARKAMGDRLIPVSENRFFK